MDTIAFFNVHKRTRVQASHYCEGRESILNLLSIFSLHFDIRLLDFVVLAYTMFYKKLKLDPCTESFLAFGDLEYLKFLNSFLTFFIK